MNSFKYSSLSGSTETPDYRLKKYHIPFFHYRYISLAAFLLLLVAFILFLLVALSSPIIKGIFLLEVIATLDPNQPATSIANTLRFGVWGLCATGVFDGPNDSGFCIGPQLGYTIPQDVLSQVSKAGASPDTVGILLHALVVLLVLHPVAAGLSFITFINSLFLGHHVVSIIALIFSILTALVSTLTAAIDLAVVIVAEDHVKNLTIGNFNVAWGNGIWMVLVAAILTWIAAVLLSARACYCCGVRRKEIEPSQFKVDPYGHS